MKILLILGALALAGCAGNSYPCGTGTFTEEYLMNASVTLQSGTVQRKTTIDCRTEKTPAK